MLLTLAQCNTQSNHLQVRSTWPTLVLFTDRSGRSTHQSQATQLYSSSSFVYYSLLCFFFIASDTSPLFRPSTGLLVTTALPACPKHSKPSIACTQDDTARTWHNTAHTW